MNKVTFFFALILLPILSIAQTPDGLVGISSSYLWDIIVPENESAYVFALELRRRGWTGNASPSSHYRFSKTANDENAYYADIWADEDGTMSKYSIEWLYTPFIYGNPSSAQRQESWRTTRELNYIHLIDQYSHSPYGRDYSRWGDDLIILTKQGVPLTLSKGESGSSIVSTFYSKKSFLKERYIKDSVLMAAVADSIKYYLEESLPERVGEKISDAEWFVDNFKFVCEDFGLDYLSNPLMDAYLSSLIRCKTSIGDYYFNLHNGEMNDDSFLHYLILLEEFEDDTRLGPKSNKALSEIMDRIGIEAP